MATLASVGRMTRQGAFFPLLFFRFIIVILDVGVANIGLGYGRRVANIG